MAEACQYMGRMLHRHIDLLDYERGCFSMATATLRTIQIHAMETTGRIQLRSQADGALYVLFRVESGTAERLEDGQPQILISPGQGVLTSPHSRSVTRWTGSCTVICIPTPWIQRAFKELIGQWIRHPIETFEIVNLRDSYLGERIDFMLEQLEMPNGIFESKPLYGFDFQNELVLTLVRRYPHSLQGLLTKHYGGSARRHTDKLDEFLAAHLGDPKMNGRSMAKHVGINERTLRNACRRIHGEGPDEVLRRMRLNRANQQLQNAQLDDTVASIAHANGFTNLGRFAQWYTEVYRESPKETLDRAKRKIALNCRVHDAS